MITSIWIVLSSLISFVIGVSIDDAFTSREYVNYLYGGELRDLNLLNNELLVGINPKNQMIGIDILNTNSIEWKVSLKDLVNDQSKVVASIDKVYVVGNDVVQIDSLGHINYMDLKNLKPKQIHPINTGLLVTDEHNNLYFVDEFNKLSSLNQIVRNSLKTDYINEHVFVIIDDTKLIKLSKNNDSVLYSIDLSLNNASIKQFKSGIILTENDQIFKFNQLSKKLIKIENNSFKNLHIIDANYLYSVNREGNTIILVSIDKSKSAKEAKKLKFNKENKVELLGTPLNEFLIISDSSIKQIYDLTDLLETKNTNSIKQMTIKSSNYPFDFIGIENDHLGMISMDQHLKGEFVSLFTGKAIKRIEPVYNQYSSSHYLMIDKPESEEIKHEVEVILQNNDSRLIFTNWLNRAVRHLSELGKFVTSIENLNNIFKFGKQDTNHGFVKLILLYQDEKFIAIRSNDGSIEWESEAINSSESLRNLKKIEDEEVFAFFDSTIVIINSRNGRIEKIKNTNHFSNVISVQNTLIFENEQEFHSETPLLKKAFFRKIGQSEITGHVILANNKDSISTWHFKFSDPIKAVSNIPNNSKVSSLGIPLSDKSVLYKYLNPNIISVLTFDDDDTKSLKLYLIDGICGNILHTISHANETIDPKSINLVMDDNWIVYSFFTKSPRLEQRINVIDLFESNYSNTTSNKIDTVSSKSFIYPERIIKLSSSQSLHGITLKSIIALTEMGNLIEIPKYVLNSRRPEEKMNANDYQNDYKLMPYTPIIVKNTQQSINHKYKFDVEGDHGEIMTQPTKYESSSVICYFNSQTQFCSLIQPSSSFDLLGKKFDKLKLVSTIIILLLVYIISKPFVYKKKLNAQWVNI